MLAHYFMRTTCASPSLSFTGGPVSFCRVALRSALPSPATRVFATVSPHRKQSLGHRSPAEQAAPGRVYGRGEGVKLESLQKKAPAKQAKNDPLLAEQTVSNKEQRKADWAIMKEMSRYLWPKVASLATMQPEPLSDPFEGQHGDTIPRRAIC